jgi:multimeric flavodoxin WrbA
MIKEATPMKVLLINGSPNKKGCTFTGLNIIREELENHGVACELIQVGNQLNKYFTISQMPVVSSCYWNGIHGYTPEDVYADAEGVRIMRTLADNMAYLIKCKHNSNVAIPEPRPAVMTNFIRGDLS